MIRVALLAGLGLWLASGASVARAMQVTWTISGTASTDSAPLDYFPNDSPYVLEITFESSTPPTSIDPGLATLYDAAIVAATFESATYSPDIDVTAPASARITVDLFTTTFDVGTTASSPEHPRLLLRFPTGVLVAPAGGVFALPTAPPESSLPIASFELIGLQDPYSVLRSSFAPSSISYSVPEPGIGALLGALLIALAHRNFASMAEIGKRVLAKAAR